VTGPGRGRQPLGDVGGNPLNPPGTRVGRALEPPDPGAAGPAHPIRDMDGLSTRYWRGRPPAAPGYGHPGRWFALACRSRVTFRSSRATQGRSGVGPRRAAAALAALLTVWGSGDAGAADTGAPYLGVADYFNQTAFHGTLRAYFFERAYSNDTILDQNAFSLGGYAGLVTAPLYGFQAGLTLGAANSLGVNPKNPKQVDTTLPGDTVYVLTEGFLQWTHKYFLVRGPDQILDTPWIMPSDSRMKPSAFRGFYGEAYPFADFKPLEDISIVGVRVFDFNGRAEGDFTPTNLYIPGHAGGSPITQLTGETVPGASAFAIKYGKKGSALNGQLWWHQFYNFSKLLWLDTNYIYKTHSGVDPLFGFQFAHQTGDGENTIALAGKGQAGTSQAYGVLAGVDTPYVRLTAAYNGITSDPGAFANGDLLSPYSTGYSTDPLYTTQMIGGLIEKQSSGSAFKVAATSFFLDQQIKGILSFARYYITPTSSYTADPAETNLDITYNFAKSSMLDGLSIRNRFGVMTGNIADGHFYYERFQIQYQF